jgi:hypothetical protein
MLRAPTPAVAKVIAVPDYLKNYSHKRMRGSTMHSSDVREWIEEYDRRRRLLEQMRGRRELERLALVSNRDDELERESEFCSRWVSEIPAPPAASVAGRGDRAAQVALLIGAAMIAALAVFFG